MRAVLAGVLAAGAPAVAGPEPADPWGHTSGGHATSPDMLRWKDLAVALREEGGVMIFSGSAVHDRRNTSGLCEGRPETCLIAVYTGHGSDRQTQNLAVSIDSGRTWRQHAGNPVLDIAAKDFRDPKVFWHELKQLGVRERRTHAPLARHAVLVHRAHLSGARSR